LSNKIGRSEPCRCGSGKKYKNCHGKAEVQTLQAAQAHEGAVPRAMAWLAQHHRKAFAAALQRETEEVAFAGFDDDEEDAARAALADVDDELWQQIQINLSEWLLAEGDIEVKGVQRRVSELLLGRGGPLFEVAQRAWIEQLAQRPLRLYDITEVVPGSGLTLCDALDGAAAPVAVVEREGSRTLRVGMQIGARLMLVADQFQLSGAVYPFAMLSGRALCDQLRAMTEAPGAYADDDALAFGMAIIEGWLAQLLKPALLPQIMHGGTGEPLLFTTDHFEVQDWPALQTALAAQGDVQGSRENGWSRLIEKPGEPTRPLLSITAQAGGHRVSLQSMSASLAESGRAWFEALAGDAATFVLREVSDPKGLLSNAQRSGAPAGVAPGLPEGVDPQELAEAIAGVVKRSYANWADEPIPALDDRTPRQAIETPTGLERVKGLLRTYEDGEAQQAAQQGRSDISYQFLWDALGLVR